MKKTILFLFALLWVSGATMAQQAQVERRSKIPFAYKDFKDGNIELAFGKDKIYKANIFLKDASLLYKNDTTVMKANLFGVISVDFGDALYRKTGDRMGKVIEQKGEVFLTVVTTIDTDRMREDARSGRNSTFLDLPEFNLFIDTNADYWAEGEGSSWPVERRIFFRGKGRSNSRSREDCEEKHSRRQKKRLQGTHEE